MAKHKYIETPEKMWELFEAYRKEVKKNPRIKIEYVGKEGDKVETPVEQPLTVEGFKCYCYEHAGDPNGYFKNLDGAYDEYLPIITRIREIIRQEQITGGMTGFYHPNLTARINNLREQQEINGSLNIKPLNIDPLSDE